MNKENEKIADLKEMLEKSAKCYGNKTIYKLENKATKVDWKKDNRKEKFILFSINGFTKRLRDLCETREDIILED